MAQADTTGTWIYLSFRVLGSSEVFRSKLRLDDIVNINETLHETLDIKMTEIVTVSSAVLFVDDSFEEIDRIHQQYLRTQEKNKFLKVNN